MKLRSRVIGVEEIPKIPKPILIKKKLLRFFNWQPADNIVLNFLRESSAHGLRYIGELDTHVFGRFFWFAAVMISLGFSILFMMRIIVKYIDSPIIVSYKPLEIGLDQIPFPAVTICNVNNIRASSVYRIIDQLNNSTRGSQEYNESILALELVDHICDQYSPYSKTFKYDRYPEYTKMKKENMAKGTFTEDYFEQDALDKFQSNTLLDNATQTCSEMILLCMWQGQEIDCNSIFRSVHTDFGSCCTFNLMPIEVMRKYTAIVNRRDESDKIIKKWKKWNIDRDLIDPQSEEPPKHQRKAGKKSGLSFLLNPELEDYYCPSSDSDGFRLITASPMDFPRVSEFGFGIPPNTDNFVDLRPELTMADANIDNVPLEKRNCYFSGDNEYKLKYYNFYSIGNCLDECVANMTFKRCNCVKLYMPREPGMKLCGDKSIACYERVVDTLNHLGISENCSMCLPSCTQISYSYGQSIMQMYELENIWRKGYEEAHWSYKNVTEVHVYFGSDAVYSRLRQRLYDASALLANTGGLLGVYLGASFVSFIEIVYHFLIKLLFKKTEDGNYVVVQKWRNRKNRNDHPEPVKVTVSTLSATFKSYKQQIGK